MYEGIDEDLLKNCSGSKIVSKMGTPQFPDVDDGSFECLLKTLKPTKTPKGKKLFEFKFKVVKSNQELVVAGKSYTLGFFPGADDVENETFWRNLSYPLAAVYGHDDIMEFFKEFGDKATAEKLGELTGLCKEEGVELDLPFRMTSKLRPAQPDKNGNYKPKQLNNDGTPKIYCNCSFATLKAPA